MDSGKFGDVFPGKLGGLSGDDQIEVTIPGEGNKLTFPLSAQFDQGFGFGPSESGEASFEDVGIEFAIAERHHLNTVSASLFEILSLG